MNNKDGGAHNQLDYLQEQMVSLTRKVDELSIRLAVIEKESATHKKPGFSSVSQVKPQASEGVLSRVEERALLPRVAAICFLLVVALILRTITDNKIIDTQLGSLLGMAYALLLVVSGWWLYEKKSRLSPVFPGCGMLLLYSIVLEAHIRYESLSSAWVYITLLTTGCITVAMGFRYRNVALVCLAILGSVSVGMVIDFPYPVFPFLGVLLLGANIAAYSAYQRKMCRFLQWFMLAFTSAFLLLWSFKLNVPAVCDEPTADLLYLKWFFPVMVFLWVTYIIIGILSILKRDLQQGFFESLLPTICVFGAFWAGRAVVIPWFGKTPWFVIVAFLFVFVHFSLALWLAARDKHGATGSNSFVFAGVCLFVMASVISEANLVWFLPVWSAVAYSLALLSEKWSSGGVRVTSYLLQATACVAAILSDAVTIHTPLPIAGMLASATLSGFSLLQYRWSRAHNPAKNNSAYFSWLDKNDHSAVVLLIACLINSFYFLNLGFYEVVIRIMTGFGFLLQSGQSIFINLGAVLLMIIALKSKNIEIVVVACLVALVGGVKVFIIDLLGIKGLPLVASVFSSGVVAAAASVVMSRWQKKTGLITET